jgi:hypothetical protein
MFARRENRNGHEERGTEESKTVSLLGERRSFRVEGLRLSNLRMMCRLSKKKKGGGKMRRGSQCKEKKSETEEQTSAFSCSALYSSKSLPMPTVATEHFVSSSGSPDIDVCSAVITCAVSASTLPERG